MELCVPPRCCKRKFLRRFVLTAFNVMCVDANIDDLLSPHLRYEIVENHGDVLISNMHDMWPLPSR